MVYERAKTLIDELTKRIGVGGSGVLKRFPPMDYIGRLDNYPAGAHYKYVSLEVKTLCTEITGAAGEPVLELYHQLVMAMLVLRAKDSARLNELPPAVREMFEINFDRILKQIEGGRAKPGYYLYSGDKFNKDMGMCRLTMIPAGAQKVYVGRLSRGFLFRGGIGQFFKGLFMVLFQTGGFQPVYRMHTDSRDRHLMKEFNPEGWVRFYKHTAALMKTDTHIKAVCGTSWFFDPAIETISPELAYLRETALAAGAKIFCAGTHDGAVRDATFMAPKRIKLYKEGKYHPKAYIMIFSRKKLLKWVADEAEA